MKNLSKNEIAKMIDHTLLSPTAKAAQIETLCCEALRYGFASVCVNPAWVSLAAKKLAGSDVAVCTVIGFPLGADTTPVKAFAANNAVLDGASEIDMVINIGRAKDGDFDFVQKDIEQVVRAAKVAGSASGKNVLVKAILETCYLSDEEIENACLSAKNGGADFVKTSTGFAIKKDESGNLLSNGASVHHVALMKKTVSDFMGVKASGGIRTAAFACELIKAGASRLGTSSGVAILEEWGSQI